MQRAFFYKEQWTDLEEERENVVEVPKVWHCEDVSIAAQLPLTSLNLRNPTGNWRGVALKDMQVKDFFPAFSNPDILQKVFSAVCISRQMTSCQ